MDKLTQIKLLAMDVDGVLTDGSMIFGQSGDIKVFNALDGLGIGLARAAGLEVAWISGNISAAVADRAQRLQVTEVHQGQRYKPAAIADISNRLGLIKEEIAYIGDDLNDLPAFEEVGIGFAVANAAPEVKIAADYVTERRGGHGAVREVIETILKAQGRWEEAIKAFLDKLQTQQEKGEAPQAVT